jgi:hypothetical protein
MAEVPLGETIEALRAELSAAVEKGADADVQFPVGTIQLEFQVGVTKSVGAKAGVKFWVIEAGGDGSISSQSVQKVTIQLDAPVDRSGQPIKVTRESASRP